MNHIPLALFVLAISVSSVSAQTEDSSSTRRRIESELRSSLDSHEAAIRKLGTSISDALEKKIEFAQSRGDLELLERAEGELDSFLANGKLPTLVRTTVFERSKLNIQRKMLRDYDAAIAEFVKSGLIDDAKLIRKRKTAFERQVDDPTLGPFLGSELVANGGCEKVLPNGRPIGWTVLSGNWTQRRGKPTAATGDAYFFSGAGKEGQIFQIIDVRPITKYIQDGKIAFSFAAKLRSYGGRPPDLAEAFVEFWNDSPETMISSQTTGPVGSSRGWSEKAIEGEMPKETRFVRIRLVSTRRDGKNNDGYFDDVTLQLDLTE